MNEEINKDELNLVKNSLKKGLVLNQKKWIYLN